MTRLWPRGGAWQALNLAPSHCSLGKGSVLINPNAAFGTVHSANSTACVPGPGEAETLPLGGLGHAGEPERGPGTKPKGTRSKAGQVANAVERSQEQSSGRKPGGQAPTAKASPE